MGQYSAAERRELLQRTITTVRRLGDQGRLSPRQKSALLTDMIQRAHAHGQQQPGPSVAEVAFDLLVGVDEDIEACLKGGALDSEVTGGLEEADAATKADEADAVAEAAAEAAAEATAEAEAEANADGVADADVVADAATASATPTAALSVDTKFDDMMGLEAKVEDFAQQCRVFADQLAASQMRR